MESVSEERRRHCCDLLAEIGRMRGKDVRVVGQRGEVAGCLPRLVLGAASPFLRCWLEEEGDLVIVPDLAPASLTLACHSMVTPLPRADQAEVQCLVEVSSHLGLPIAPLIQEPREEESETYLKDELLHEEQEDVELEEDKEQENNNMKQAEEPLKFHKSQDSQHSTPSQNLEVAQESVPVLESKMTVIPSCPVCPLCYCTCESLAALELHLGQHCQVQGDISCDDCKQNFPSLEQLSAHCQSVHGAMEGAQHLQHLLLGRHLVCSLQTESGEGGGNTVSGDREGGRRFQCERCEKQFGTRVQLKHHMNIHLGIKPYVCSVCNKAFTQPTHLKVHSRTHNGARPYMCSICGKTFAIASNMRKHAAIHDRDAAEVPPDHGLVQEERERELPQEMLPFPCNYCPERFDALKKLSVHERKEHGKQHSCPHAGCSRLCISASQLEKHLLTHTGEKPHACPICNKAFTQKSHMTHHVNTVHTESGGRERSHICSQCGKCFVSKGVLAKHMMLHSDMRPHQCDLCDKAFVQKSHLKAHMTHHTGDRSFVCPECGKNFTTKHHLKEHRKLHTDSKSWLSCTHGQCTARYRAQADLTIHMRRHTGETPFPCTECRKEFRSERSLENHRRIHSGAKPFVCDLCNKRFATPSGLRQHFKHNQRCREAAKPGSFSSKRNAEMDSVQEEEIDKTCAEFPGEGNMWISPA